MHDAPELFFGSSAVWLPILEQIQDFAPTLLSLLLLGPTGSGKTVLARLIHQRSKRTGEFVECALPDIPSELRHTVLAGHAKGAFTGAYADAVGKIEQAGGGTLFLDELALVTSEVQDLLLLALDRQWILRVGEQRRRPVNVRFLFATNQEPLHLLQKGIWRGDFYYRLGFNYIRLPGLAERRRDIMPLAERFLELQLKEDGKPFRSRFSAGVEDLFVRHPWPGNVRELKSVCQHAAVRLREDRPVEVTDLPEPFLAEGHAGQPGLTEAGNLAGARRALERAGGNKAAAARELGVTRQRFYRLLDRAPRHTPSGGFRRPG